ncbi:hypothetical protein [Brevibacterium sp. 2SA]|uniref:hypothetical protein n=1 Tax=Brevibacterium sp. 2SA TaxID=2502198 RepID=UPI0010FA214D|nr:hypothetical protein [Brevibacterium sp. 2SA]
MSAEVLIAIAGAVLGSSVVTAIIQLVANRFRFDRRAQVLQAWKDELKIAEELERVALDGDKIGQSYARNNMRIAFSAAVRSDLNRKLALQLIPSNMVTIIVLLTVGFGTLVTGSLIALINASTAEPRGESYYYAIVLAILGLLMLIFGIVIDNYTRQIRSTLLSKLNPTYKPEEIQESTGLNKFGRFVLPKDIWFNAGNVLRHIDVQSVKDRGDKAP